jgi:hypothetical protein
VLAAKHLQSKGLDEADAQRLATAFSEKLSPPLTKPADIDVSMSGAEEWVTAVLCEPAARQFLCCRPSLQSSTLAMTMSLELLDLAQDSRAMAVACFSCRCAHLLHALVAV